MSTEDKDKLRLVTGLAAKIEARVILGSFKTGAQLDNASSVLSPRVPTNPKSSNRFQRAAKTTPSTLGERLNSPSVSAFIDSKRLVKERVANPTPMKLIEEVDFLPPFELMRGRVPNGERSLEYVVHDVRGLFYTANFTVLATKQHWAIFLPTDEMIVELLRLWGKKKYAIRLRKFSTWLVASTKIEFLPNTNVIKSAVLQREMFQTLLLNELGKMVNKAAILIQTIMRNFKVKKTQQLKMLQELKIRRGRMTAIERVKAHEKETAVILNSSLVDDRKKSVVSQMRSNSLSSSLDAEMDIPLLKPRARLYSTGYAGKVHKAAHEQGNRRPSNLLLHHLRGAKTSRPGTNHDSDPSRGTISPHQGDEDRKVSVEDAMNHLRHELESQRNEIFYAIGESMSYNAEEQDTMEERLDSHSSYGSPRKASTMNVQNKANKEVKQMKTELEHLQKQIQDMNEAFSLQQQQNLDAAMKAEEEIQRAKESAEKRAVETAEQVKQEAMDAMTAQLQAKEQHTSKLLQRQRILESQREEMLRKEMEEKYKELEGKILADSQAAQERQENLRSQLAELKKQQQTMEVKKRTQIHREKRNVLDDDQSEGTARRPYESKAKIKVGSPRHQRRHLPKNKNIEVSKRAVSINFDDSEEEYEEEEGYDDPEEAIRQQQIVKNLNMQLENPHPQVESPRKKGWLSWLFTKKNEPEPVLPMISPPSLHSMPRRVTAVSASGSVAYTSGRSGISAGNYSSIGGRSGSIDEQSGLWGEHNMPTMKRRTIRKKPNPEKEKKHAMAKRIQDLVRYRLSRKKMAQNKSFHHLRKKALLELLPSTTDAKLIGSALSTAIELKHSKLMERTLDRKVALLEEYDFKEEALPLNLVDLAKAFIIFFDKPQILEKGLEIIHKVFKIKPILMSKHDIAEHMYHVLLQVFIFYLDESVLLLLAMRLLPRLAKRNPEIYCTVDMLMAVRTVLEKVYNTDLDILERLLRFLAYIAMGSRPRQELVGQMQLCECVFMSLLHNYTQSPTLIKLHCHAICNFCAENGEANQSSLGRGVYPNLLVKTLVMYKNDTVLLSEVIKAMVSVYANNCHIKPKFLAAAASEVLIDLCTLHSTDESVICRCIWALSYLACNYKPQVMNKIITTLKQYERLDNPVAVRDEARKAGQRFFMGMSMRPNTPLPHVEPPAAELQPAEPADLLEAVKETEQDIEDRRLDEELRAIHNMSRSVDMAEHEHTDNEVRVEHEDHVEGDVKGIVPFDFHELMSSKFSNFLKSDKESKSRKMVENARLVAMSGSTFSPSEESQ